MKRIPSRRVVLSLSLILAGAPACATWVKVSESAYVDFYIDPTTIRKDGPLRRVWEMHDLKQRHPDGGMSGRAVSEYDCKGERSRVISLSAYSEPMADGKTLMWLDVPNGNWTYIPPGTAAETVFRIVCAS